MATTRKATGAKVSAVLIKNLDKLKKKLNDKTKNLTPQLIKNMELAVDLVYNTAKIKRRDMLLQKKGNRDVRVQSIFRRPGQGIRRVSDPSTKIGVPVRSGALRDSIKKSVRVVGRNKVVGKVWSDSPYAIYVERGTSKMRARPFMRPALDTNRQAINKILKTKLKP